MRIQRLKLKKLNNTRDLGGMPTEGGKKTAYGKLLRSGKLYRLPKQTQKKLLEMGLTDIIDLRTDLEREEYPSTVLEGVNYHILPLMCTATAGITYSRSMAATMREESQRISSEFGTADNYMKSMYEIILFSDYSRPLFTEFFKILIKAEGCVLWHCNGGKDRTGIAAMLVEWLLGVDENTIVCDYSASEKFQKRVRRAQKFGLKISPLARNFKAILYALMDAKPQYIKGAMDAIKTKYGGVEEYIIQALGITPAEIEIIKNKYLTD